MWHCTSVAVDKFSSDKSRRPGLSSSLLHSCAPILLKCEAILFLFQTYIDIFKNIAQCNPVAIGISVVAILLLSIYNEVIKVSEILHKF
jgi:hypothetical protein